MGNSNFNGLDAGLAIALVGNYADNHLNAINDDPDLTSLRQDGSASDSRSVWFSLNTINSFINAIQNAAASNCPAINGNLGIRIYFGEYPSADSDLWGSNALSNDMASYAGMHTLVMVPTYNDGIVNMDFDPNFANPDGSPMPLSLVCDNVLQKSGTAGINTSPLTMLNHGSLSPPPFEPGVYGITTGAAFLDVVDQ